MFSTSEPQVETASAEMTPERAYAEAKKGFELFGKELLGYSPARKVAAQTMGLQYPFIGIDYAAQYDKTGAYPGMIRDAIVLLWVCTIKAASEQTVEEVKTQPWNLSRVMRAPDRAMDDAMAWAASEEFLDPDLPRFAEAIAVFAAIVSGVEASQFELSSPESEPVTAEGELVGTEGPTTEILDPKV